jgi:hypothetical protein
MSEFVEEGTFDLLRSKFPKFWVEYNGGEVGVGEASGAAHPWIPEHLESFGEGCEADLMELKDGLLVEVVSGDSLWIVRFFKGDGGHQAAESLRKREEEFHSRNRSQTRAIASTA